MHKARHDCKDKDLARQGIVHSHVRHAMPSPTTACSRIRVTRIWQQSTQGWQSRKHANAQTLQEQSSDTLNLVRVTMVNPIDPCSLTKSHSKGTCQGHAAMASRHLNLWGALYHTEYWEALGPSAQDAHDLETTPKPGWSKMHKFPKSETW